MGERIIHMLRKEFIQILRDPRMKFILFVAPVVQLLVFGYAATTDVRNIATAVLDRDNSVASRELVGRFVHSGYFEVVGYVSDDEQVRQELDHGRARAALVVDHGFAEDLAAGRTARLQIILDGTDSTTARVVMDYGTRIAGQFSDSVLATRLERLGAAARPPGRVDLRSRNWFNDNLESRDYYVPGVIAMIVMLVTLLLTSMAVVREKEIGTMEQIMVTPITPTEFILGKTVPFALIGFLNVIVVTVAGVFWFEVPIRGSLALLFASTALYLMTALGVGLLISTISRTQQQAMMSTFFFYFPAILLSGFMFPIANMPEAIQWLTYANPLRYFLVIVRGIFLKGVGADILWPQMLGLFVLGCLTLWLAGLRFRKTLA
jgi:ABC-2 type transport system permease protein